MLSTLSAKQLLIVSPQDQATWGQAIHGHVLVTRPGHAAANATPPAALQAHVLCHRDPLAGRDSLQSREAGTGKKSQSSLGMEAHIK